MSPIAAWALDTGVPMALLAIIAARLWVHKCLINRLKREHHVLWLDLGAPGLWTVAIPSRYTNYWLPNGRISYRGWLWRQDYEAIQDPKVNSLVRWLRVGFGVFIALFLVLLTVNALKLHVPGK
jgi:hypothetical protein